MTGFLDAIVSKLMAGGALSGTRATEHKISKESAHANSQHNPTIIGHKQKPALSSVWPNGMF